jgi:hypothetical protein
MGVLWAIASAHCHDEPHDLTAALESCANNSVRDQKRDEGVRRYDNVSSRN